MGRLDQVAALFCRLLVDFQDFEFFREVLYSHLNSNVLRLLVAQFFPLIEGGYRTFVQKKQKHAQANLQQRK
jgi:hypothetical protein